MHRLAYSLDALEIDLLDLAAFRAFRPSSLGGTLRRGVLSRIRLSRAVLDAIAARRILPALRRLHARRIIRFVVLGADGKVDRSARVGRTLWADVRRAAYLPNGPWYLGFELTERGGMVWEVLRRPDWSRYYEWHWWGGGSFSPDPVDARDAVFGPGPVKASGVVELDGSRIGPTLWVCAGTSATAERRAVASLLRICGAAPEKAEFRPTRCRWRPVYWKRPSRGYRVRILVEDSWMDGVDVLRDQGFYFVPSGPCT